MLYGYDLTINQMNQIRNWRKKKKLNNKLYSMKELDLSTFEAFTTILFKQTVPLNLFEKYSLKIIQKADEIYADVNINKIAELLHLDENLIRSNLNNLHQIDMISGFDSDNITINFNENAEYLQYENKFKKEKMQKSFYLTKKEFENIDIFIKKEFEKGVKDNDKKFLDFDLIENKESTKKVKLLKYTDNQFLIYSDQGVNNENDVKFLDTDILENSNNQTFDQNSNFFCHKEEILPILRDKVSLNKNNELVVVLSSRIENKNLEIINLNKNKNDLYIFTNENEKADERIFSTNIDLEDIFIIGDEYYIRKNEFIYIIDNLDEKKRLTSFISKYFIDKIKDIEPNYNTDKLEQINTKIEETNELINSLNFMSKKDFDRQIQLVNENKNKLYGIDLKDSKKRLLLREKIDNLDKDNNMNELDNYPIYLVNRDEIRELKENVEELEIQKEKLAGFQRDLNKYNKEKLNLISEDNKEKVAQFEKELKNINRIRL